MHSNKLTKHVPLWSDVGSKEGNLYQSYFKQYSLQSTIHHQFPRHSIHVHYTCNKHHHNHNSDHSHHPCAPQPDQHGHLHDHNKVQLEMPILPTASLVHYDHYDHYDPYDPYDHCNTYDHYDPYDPYDHYDSYDHYDHYDDYDNLNIDIGSLTEAGEFRSDALSDIKWGLGKAGTIIKIVSAVLTLLGADSNIDR